MIRPSGIPSYIPFLLITVVGCGVDAPTPDDSSARASAPPPIMETEPNNTGDPEAIRPFVINVPDTVLEDLRNRLARTRLPDQIPGTAWDYGTNRD